jgi:hypothetical protein
MELQLPTSNYIIVKIMLFTLEAINLTKYRQLWTDACKSKILIIKINTSATKWIDTVKNE